MAKGAIKGITVEIGGDLTKLDKALSGSNKSIRDTQKELREVEKLLKLDPKNTELLAQKQKLLAEAVNETKEKLNTLKEAEKQVQEQVQRGEASQKQYDALRREVIETEQSLNKLEKAAEDTGEEIEDSGKKSEAAGNRFEKLAEMAKDVAAKITAVFAAVATAAGAIAVKLGKEVISAYGEYEQLVGGVDTLFKDSSKKLQEYAADAYKTAGLNANEYMETVTSFSASLISSLGGDTEKAVEYANMAITDMSDNANKMGTDMSLIQSAYQGFAKQNYTMLDNLKLGYGGTKTEMGRLLADAEAISGIKYDVSSYADVVAAIHVIQEEMGIAGSTAQEAEHTITGSINSFQSALGNFTVGLGNADADMAKLTQNLADTFQSVVDNIKPVIENIVAALPEAFDAILSALSDLSPEILSIATDLISQILNMLISLLPELISAAIDVVLPIIMALFQDMPLIAGTVLVAALAPAISMFGKMSQGISSMIGLYAKLKAAKVADAAVTTTATAAQNGLNLAMLANPVALVVAAIVALIAVFVLLYNNCEWFRDGVNAIWEAIKTAFFAAFDAIKIFFTETLPNAFNAVVDFVKNNWQGLLLLLINPFAGAFKLIYDNCEGFRNTIDTLVANIIAFFQNLWDSIVAIFSGVGAWFNDRFTEAYTNVTNVFKAIGQWFAARWLEIQQAFSSVASWFQSTFQNAYTNISNVFNAIGQWFRQRYDDICNAFKDIPKFFEGVFTNVVDTIKKVFGGVVDWFSDAVNKIKGFFNSIADSIRSAIDDANDAAASAKSSSKSSSSKTPAFATGGILRSGRGIVAEAGPELIEIVNGNAIITPLTNSATNTPVGASGASASGGFTQNNYNTFYSTQSIDAYEAARQTRNANRIAALALQGY